MVYLIENKSVILCFSYKWILKVMWKERMLKFQQYIVWVERHNEVPLYLISEVSKILFSYFDVDTFLHIL